MKIICAALLLVISFTTSSDEYWHYQDYLNKYPHQISILRSFKELVENAAQEISIKQVKKTKIVMIYPEDQVSDYWRRNIMALKKRLIESKVAFELEVIPTPTGGNIKKESAKILEAIKKKPDYLIFTLNVKEHSKLINQTLAYSPIKLILLNITTPLKSWEKNQPFFYVGFDHEEGTQKLIEEVGRRLPNGGSYAVLYHSKGYVSKMRGDYAIKELSKDRKWKLVSRYYTDANPKKVEIALKDLFSRNKKIDLIISCATDISLKAQMFKADHKFLLNGWGGGSAEIDSLLRTKNGIDFSVMRMNDDSAIAIAEAIKLDLQGNAKKVPQIFSGSMTLITKETSSPEISSLIEKAFRYSNERN
ncbi:substrate-binding domain-containing protein [Halobacteriovorax sp. JY17]|uniref:substrate-binding domain-containing protein n=1 Tax=Halobacteriovorax sp. JY17 TaxID=2014617 RepID=UPI000C6010E8|nr:substrate-binding domain-containing protein [Halobacteriovorax sp. JY17]PIK16695.1 MAG: ABC transporter substrate-binding protein [Halobacteriovorax sp. JY17]